MRTGGDGDERTRKGESRGRGEKGILREGKLLRERMGREIRPALSV